MKFKRDWKLDKVKYLLFLGLIFFGFTGSGQTSGNYKEDLIRVEGFLRNGDMPSAVGLLDDLTKKYPDTAEVFYAKALLLGQTGNIDGAIESARIAYQKDPNFTHANYLLELSKAKKDYVAVVELLKDMRAKHPMQPIIGRELITILGNTEKIDEALVIYKEEQQKGFASDTLDVIMGDAYVANKKFAEAKSLLLPLVSKSKLRHVYGTLGYIHMQEENSKVAIDFLQKGVEESGDPVLYLDLADAYRADKKTKQTFESLKIAFESNKVEFVDKHRVMLNLMNPNFNDFSLDQIQSLANTLVLVHPRIAESHVLKGEVMWRRGSLEEARSLFLTAVGINSKHIDAWRMLINVELGLNQIDDAIAHGQEALSLNPRNPMLMYFTGISYVVKEDYENGRMMLESALNFSQQENKYLQSMIYGSLGDLYHQIKMDAASDVAYEEAIKLDSNNVTALNNFAYYLSVRNKDLDKAAQYSLRSIEVEPNSATFQDTYAWILFQQGKYKEALPWMEKAIKNSSTDSAVLYEHYGDILFKLGKTKEALKQWQKALGASEKQGVDLAKIQQKIQQKTYVD